MLHCSQTANRIITTIITITIIRIYYRSMVRLLARRVVQWISIPEELRTAVAIHGGLTACHESRSTTTVTTTKAAAAATTTRTTTTTITTITVAAARSVQHQISDGFSVQLITIQTVPHRKILSKTVKKIIQQKVTSVVPTTSDNCCGQHSIYLQNLSAREKVS